MFHVKTEEEEHEYELSEELSEYANHYMSKYINDKGLKEKILTENPVPTNIDKVKVMDEFLKGIMKDKKKSNEILLDSILEKVQKKTRDIFGPLARMWDYLENVVKKPSDEGESISVNLEGLLSYTQQTVLVLGQALNTVSYHRKYNALSVLMSPNEAKTTIREEGDLLGKKDILLGNEFREQFMKNKEAKRKTLAALPHSTSTSRNYQPFRLRPSSQFHRGGGGGPSRFVYNRKQHQVGRQNNFQSRGGGKIEQEQPLPQNGGISCLSTKLKIEQSSSHGKKYFPGIGYSKSPISRKTSTFSKVLGKNDKGSKHTGYNKGLSETIQVKSSSTQKLERDPIEQKSKGTNRYGNLRNVEEGSNKNLSSFANSVSKQSLLGSQEGRGSPSSHKFERIKQKHTLLALQNGGLALSKVHVATGRLHVQARHEGRLFLSSPKQKLKGKSSFSVVREAIRVPLPLFRPGSCTKDLYKNLKSSHVAFKAIEHSNNHISGRHVITGKNNGGDLSSQRHTNLSVATSGVCNKSKEISTRTTTKNGISGLNNRFSEPLIVTDRTKTAESKKLLCGDAQGDQSVHFRVDKTSRAAVFNCSSSTTSTTTNSVFATTSDSHAATRTLLLPTNHSESKIQTRINMVDSKFKPLQWKVPCTTSTTDDNSNGCLQDRVGSCLSGRKNEGCVVGTGAKTPYQYIRTVSSEISPFEFYKEQNSEQYSLPNIQHDSNKILDKNGRDKKCETGEPEQRDLGISFRSWDHNYHRIPSECNECDSRSGVQGKDGLFRMDAMSKSFFSDLQTYGGPRDRSFCLTQFSSASALHSLASRSLQPGNRCHATELVRKVSLSIPSILSHKQDSPESNQRKNINDDFDNSNMALSTMVPPVLHMSIEKPVLLPKQTIYSKIL